MSTVTVAWLEQKEEEMNRQQKLIVITSAEIANKILKFPTITLKETFKKNNEWRVTLVISHR